MTRRKIARDTAGRASCHVDTGGVQRLSGEMPHLRGEDRQKGC